jgi:CBS domain-containing protein
MVKSYQGPITKKRDAPKQAGSVNVESYMSKKLITFKPDQVMFDVIQSLIKNRISGAPVVDDRGKLCGVISEGDCVKEAVKGKYNNMPSLSGKVEDYMTREVVTISPDVNIFDAADMFLNRRIRRFPVVRDGVLLGQISQKDIMRAVVALRSETW